MHISRRLPRRVAALRLIAPCHMNPDSSLKNAQYLRDETLEACTALELVAKGGAVAIRRGYPGNLDRSGRFRTTAGRGLLLQSFRISSIAQRSAGTVKHRQGLFPTILLHFLHPWRSDVREWPSLEVRCARAAIAQGCAGAAKHRDCARAAISGGQTQEVEQRREQLPSGASDALQAPRAYSAAAVPCFTVAL